MFMDPVALLRRYLILRQSKTSPRSIIGKLGEAMPARMGNELGSDEWLYSLTKGLSDLHIQVAELRLLGVLPGQKEQDRKVGPGVYISESSVRAMTDKDIATRLQLQTRDVERLYSEAVAIVRDNVYQRWVG